MEVRERTELMQQRSLECVVDWSSEQVNVFLRTTPDATFARMKEVLSFDWLARH